MNDLEVFRHIPQSALRPWLEKERAAAYKYLAEAADPVGIHRAQGKVQFVEKMISIFDKLQSTR